MAAAWRLVLCLGELVDNVDELAPGRSRASDGTIGDLAHQAEATSDHNPHLYPALGPVPVVCAADITHDPAHGADTYAIAETMRQAADPRVGYIISNRRITGPAHGWLWHAYAGTDPHTGHLHASTVHTALADNQAPWHITPEDTMTSKSDAILAAFAGGNEHAADGTTIAPVTWEIRREQWQATITAALAADQVRDAAAQAAIQALAGAGGADAAPIIAAVTAVRDEARAAFTDLHDQLAAAQARNAQLEHDLATALNAGA
jgi:hypothetical protein